MLTFHGYGDFSSYSVYEYPILENIFLRQRYGITLGAAALERSVLAIVGLIALALDLQTPEFSLLFVQ